MAASFNNVSSHGNNTFTQAVDSTLNKLFNLLSLLIDIMAAQVTHEAPLSTVNALINKSLQQ
ncbi:MAG: hypothetical protein RKH07_00870 [Gammaproteobacteria bacterium]